MGVATWAAVGLSYALRCWSTHRWVIMLICIGLVAGLAASSGFSAEIAWVNDYLE
ncbi:MAG TPA: hypothetical protein PLG38_07500 [Propionibacteriaceae bacterium]|nr:hypothetical protein [Propionibacteriaceae bacterium]